MPLVLMNMPTNTAASIATATPPSTGARRPHQPYFKTTPAPDPPAHPQVDQATPILHNQTVIALLHRI